MKLMYILTRKLIQRCGVLFRKVTAVSISSILSGTMGAAIVFCFVLDYYFLVRVSLIPIGCPVCIVDGGLSPRLLTATTVKSSS